MNAIIFGASGQDGHYLARILKREGLEVAAVSRHSPGLQLDVSDALGVRNIVRKLKPKYIFHLAATSTISHDALWSNHASIASGTLAILDAVAHEHPLAKVFIAGSALQFVNRGEPIDESAELDYSNPYSLARNHSLYASRYFRSRGLKVYFGFLFHHDSPFRSSQHLSMRIAEAAAQAASGSKTNLKIGDIEARKEFNFAGDITEAIWSLISQDSVFESVIGSGICHPITEWIRLCYRHVGLDWTKHVQIDPSFQSTYQRIVSNPAKIYGLNWRPRTSLNELTEIIMQEALHRTAILSP